MIHSEERLRLSLEAGKMATWDWNLENNQQQWNDEHYRMLGYEPGSIQPSYQAWKDQVHTDDVAVIEARFLQCMKEGSAYSAEYRVRKPNGALPWIEAHGHFEMNAEGRPTRSLGVLQDITERKQTEQALRDAIPGDARP